MQKHENIYLLAKKEKEKTGKKMAEYNKEKGGGLLQQVVKF